MLACEIIGKLYGGINVGSSPTLATIVCGYNSVNNPLESNSSVGRAIGGYKKVGSHDLRILYNSCR
jgi:hypothetical protein